MVKRVKHTGNLEGLKLTNVSSAHGWHLLALTVYQVFC